MTRINFATILSLFFFLSVYGQGKSETVGFSHIYFYQDGSVYKTERKTFEVDTILTIEFYKANFNMPYYTPQEFIDKRFSNRTIKVWQNGKKTKDNSANWYLEYVYDSASRVIFYNYSSCLLCSQSPFITQISYDFKNHPVKFSIRSSVNSLQEDTSYLFLYDDKDNIIQVKRFISGKLTDQIEKI